MTPLLPQDFERAVGGAIAVAVSTVAERSFFACVDRCDMPDLDEIHGEWLVATVRFDDGPVYGSLACALPADLALWLYDAFSGRDPVTPMPRPDQLDDLIGEFSNMVCGTWLTRCEAHRVFRLSPPDIERVMRPEDQGDLHREWLMVNNRPVAIDWAVAQAPAGFAGVRPGL
jgi:hypothetical protein